MVGGTAMKKIAAIILAVSAFAACTRTQQPDSCGSELVTITASAPVLKGSLDRDQFYVWNPGDRILVEVMNGSSKQYVEFATTEGGASAQFTGTVPSGATVGSAAYYPADAFSLQNGISATISQSYEGALKNAPIPMVGKRWGGDAFTFQAAAGALKITYQNVPPEFGDEGTVVFQATEATNGTYNYDSESGKIVWDASKYASRGSFSSGSKISVRADVTTGRSIFAYVPLPENSNWGNMKISLLKDTGQTFLEKEIPQGTEVPIEAGRVSRLPGISFPAEIYLVFNPNDGDFSMWDNVPNSNDPRHTPWTWRSSWMGEDVYSTEEFNIPAKQVKFLSDEKYLYGYLYVDLSIQHSPEESVKNFYVMLDNDDISSGQSFGSNNIAHVPTYSGYNVMLYGEACVNGVPGEWKPTIYDCTEAAGASDTKISGSPIDGVSDAGYGGGTRNGDILEWEFIIDKSKTGLYGRTSTNICVTLCSSTSSPYTIMPSIAGFQIDL